MINSPLQLRLLLNKPELGTILEALLEALNSFLTVEDLDGRTLLGRASEAACPEYPVMAQEHIIGWVKGGEFAPLFARLLTYLAHQELLVILDGLTGIANRRYLDRYLFHEWGRSQREDLYLSLLLVDLDFFKAYNDYYGHQAGDDCLRLVTELICRTLKRQADLIARYGGEEFAIILPNTNSRGAQIVAETLCLAVRRLQIPHHRSPVNPYVTISIGISTWIPSTEKKTLENFIREADMALYRAKMSGRNRYCL